MSSIVNFETKSHRSAAYLKDSSILVHVYNKSSKSLAVYSLSSDHLSIIEDISSHDLLVSYAAAPAAISVETPCPCPPETAKPALVAVDGGILFDNGLSIKNILCAHCLNATPAPELKEFLGWCHDCFYTT